MQRVDEEVFCRVFPKEPVEHEKQKEKWNESKQVYKSLFRNVSYRLMPWDFFLNCGSDGKCENFAVLKAFFQSPTRAKKAQIFHKFCIKYFLDTQAKGLNSDPELAHFLPLYI